MNTVDKLAKLWLKRITGSYEDTGEVLMDDARDEARFWLNKIAHQAPFGEIRDWLRAQAEEKP